MGMGIYLISMVIMGIGALVQMRLKSKFHEYAAQPLQNGMSGAEIAEKMLRDNGIFDVKVVSVPGFLSDHYNPSDKTVNLSPEVFSGRSISSAAVAAHECGHAVQHATAYSMLQLRSKLVPAVQFSSMAVQWVLLAGVLMIRVFPQLLMIGVALFAVTTLFSLITLPVEYDASNRALQWLDSTRITTGEEHDKAKDALKWAARTYLVAAIGSVVTLMYYVMMILGNRNRN